MKEPLLRLDPVPDLDSEPSSEGGDEGMAPEEAPDLLSLPHAEPLLDPLTLATPPSRPAKRKSFRLSWLVLSLAGTAVLLSGVILGMRISDYYHGRYFERRFAKLLEAPADSTPTDVRVLVEPAGEPQPSPAGTSILAPPASLSGDPAVPDAGLPPQPSPAGLASAKDTGFEGELEALRQERQLMTQRFEQLNAARRGPSGSRELGAPSSGLPDAPLPSATPSFGKAGSGAAPLRSGASSQLSVEEQRVKDAPAIARVREYDPDWHFVVLDGGKERNLTPGTQLAVRRGHEILGLIRVDEVEEKESVAELQGTWRTDAQARKPSRGDDVVTYPLF